MSCANFWQCRKGIGVSLPAGKVKCSDDINSYSNTAWQYNRLSHSDNDVACGIAGFGIQTSNSNAEINISLGQTFKTLKFFIDEQPSLHGYLAPGKLLILLKITVMITRCIAR